MGIYYLVWSLVGAPTSIFIQFLILMFTVYCVSVKYMFVKLLISNNTFLVCTAG